ncbi:hypothetical protein SDC9_61793 [bioreactor metagenome]|uniref:DUF2177 domain-containing protein n=1 Tax=bioreactor metagenome TaxID=1076179 RepID=A0A644XGR9_9ZZZZ
MIKQFFVALGSFLVVDGLWLTLIAKNFYAKHLGYLMSKNPNLLAAGLFYLIYVFAMVVLVVTPGIEKGSFWSTVLSGALFGLCCYATYDLTNLATVQNWPLIVTIVDLIWGTFLSATIAAISFLIFHK